jgi:hypothetical protein
MADREEAPRPLSRMPNAEQVLRLQRTLGNIGVRDLLDPGHAAVRQGLPRSQSRARLRSVGAAALADTDLSLSSSIQRKVKHTTGEKVDTYIDASPFIKTYVADKVKGGTKAAGHVHIHNDADFTKAVVAYLVKHSNPDTGKTFTEDEAKAWAPTVNAFQDDKDIHIHEDRGEVSTSIHESMHLFEDDSFLSKGWDLSEGATEFFTRILCKEQKIERTGFYESQLSSVKKLVDATSKETLAGAYYQGKVAALTTAVDAKAAGTFAKWLAFMNKKKYADADALL